MEIQFQILIHVWNSKCLLCMVSDWVWHFSSVLAVMCCSQKKRKLEASNKCKCNNTKKDCRIDRSFFLCLPKETLIIDRHSIWISCNLLKSAEAIFDDRHLKKRDVAMIK